ncbi:MAG: prepilin-type N-terminal cleavage/methylation domain-containing protein [Candidatus Paceibacterota bacterium]|jgi:prepilin-type N-terminal cleavage/methylation domain-containing protein
MRAYRGFSLIEIIISIFIIGIMLVLLQAVIRGGSLARAAQNQGIALSIAQGEIESLRASGYDNLPSSGTFTDSLLDTLPIATASLSVSDYNDKTKQVTVNVLWQNSGFTASSTVSLSTLITQTGGLP